MGRTAVGSAPTLRDRAAAAGGIVTLECSVARRATAAFEASVPIGVRLTAADAVCVLTVRPTSTRGADVDTSRLADGAGRAT